jgi:hypothetical protein
LASSLPATEPSHNNGAAAAEASSPWPAKPLLAPPSDSGGGAAAATLSSAPPKRKKAGAVSADPKSGKNKHRQNTPAAAAAAAAAPSAQPHHSSDAKSGKKRRADGPAAAVSPASSGPTPSAKAYATSDHVLEHQKIETGFTDGGRGGVARAVEACRSDTPTKDEREIIEVDLGALSRFISKCKTDVAGCSNPREAFKTLAKMCSSRLGGKRATTDDAPTMKHLNELRSELRSNCVPIHHLESGVCRHRALLFKILCWECASPAMALPCRFIRGDFTNSYGVGGHAWNVVRVDNDWFLCDLMQNPGKL